MTIRLAVARSSSAFTSQPVTRLNRSTGSAFTTVKTPHRNLQRISETISAWRSSVSMASAAFLAVRKVGPRTFCLVEEAGELWRKTDIPPSHAFTRALGPRIVGPDVTPKDALFAAVGAVTGTAAGFGQTVLPHRHRRVA